MSRVVFLTILLGAFFSLAAHSPHDGAFLLPGAAYAQEDWKKEFDDICSKTQDAMAFSPGELRSLVERCNRLRPLIEKLDETRRKVYLKRLQMCRDLFSFVLESKEKN